ncbi:MAG: TIGR00296 family protein [Candidatus Bathyarchaeota archaeon]|jgi:uncharacterized protein (TIGR00296 family)|nr:TIGR00296 family protein [Candidatus Bathyarchaeota archaeon]
MEFQITNEDGQFLIDLARKTITEYIATQQVVTTPSNSPIHLLQPRGVFVTLTTQLTGEKMLRGCIGYPEPQLPLLEATISAAISAATRDPRFTPISVTELDKILIEISILTLPILIKVKKATDYPKHIQIGRDGLIIERGIFKGLLLPQVPIEWNWDADEFLAHCCEKAGLLSDAWLLPGTKISTFSCILIQEHSVQQAIKLIDMRK